LLRLLPLMRRNISPTNTKALRPGLLREEFRGLESRLPSPWSRSYHVARAGHVSARMIQKYIERQKRS